MPSREIEGQRAEVGKQSRPSTGGYYWLPTPGRTVPGWDVISCHDLGLDCGIGHSELWPAVIDRLAIAWGKDASRLRRLLKNHYTGLPRGRVTRPGRGYLVLHGDDAPVLDWEVCVVRRFHLEGSRFTVVYDEHERMLSGDPHVIESTLDLKGSH